MRLVNALRDPVRSVSQVLALLLVTVAGCQQSSTPRGADAKDPPQVGPPSSELLTGTLSCSGRGCHADFERPSVKDQEPSRYSYTRWLHQDPHTRAYKVLFEPLAVEMGKKLDIKNVAEDPRCLACHCTPQAALDGPAAREERIFGVGCEACHGPARDWLVPHRDAAWKKMTKDEKRAQYEKFKMNWLQSHAVRAEVCAGCHVGAPADAANGLLVRDMNHDFIAAGHPRLMFEYGSFLANEPKHWVEKATFVKDPKRWQEERAEADFEARVWLVGQAASTRAALRLLADRARGAEDSGKVWPEFSEYDCFACHHDLEGKSWRQQRVIPGDAIGAPFPARWYTSLLPVVHTAAPDIPLPLFDTLTKTMRLRLPVPKTVKTEARAALKPLDSLAEALETRKYDRADLANLRKKLVALAETKETSNWDELEQVALGLKALELADRALREQKGDKAMPADEKISAAVRELLDKLAFPRSHNSPRGIRPTDYDETLEQIFNRLK